MNMQEIGYAAELIVEATPEQLVLIELNVIHLKLREQFAAMADDDAKRQYWMVEALDDVAKAIGALTQLQRKAK